MKFARPAKGLGGISLTSLLELTNIITFFFCKKIAMRNNYYEPCKVCYGGITLCIVYFYDACIHVTLLDNLEIIIN